MGETSDAWSIYDVDRWLREAHDTRRRLHVRGHRHTDLGSSMPVPVPEQWLNAINDLEIGDRSDDYDGPPPAPSAAEIARLNVVDDWLVKLNVDERWIVHRRSAGRSWRDIRRLYWQDKGKRHSPETFRARYWRAVTKIADRLHGAKINLDKLDGLDA